MAIELVRLGLPRASRRELGALNRELVSQKRIQWALAYLLNKTGDYARSLNIPRRKVPDFKTFYPKGGHHLAWEIAYPRPYASYFTRYSKEHGVPVELAFSIAREESSFNPRIESWANAIGMMQLLLSTAKGVAKGLNLNVTPQTLRQAGLNVRLGTRFLGKLLKRFKGNTFLAAAGYNAGGGRVNGWLKKRRHLPLDEFVEEIPPKQTRGYTKRVMNSFTVYWFLYTHKNSGLPEISFSLPK
jgi:soluble lytic murein transglycosylase